MYLQNRKSHVYTNFKEWVQIQYYIHILFICYNILLYSYCIIFYDFTSVSPALTEISMHCTHLYTVQHTGTKQFFFWSTNAHTVFSGNEATFRPHITCKQNKGPTVIKTGKYIYSKQSVSRCTDSVRVCVQGHLGLCK